jgi:Protein of unknown function (DUF3237)
MYNLFSNSDPLTKKEKLCMTRPNLAHVLDISVKFDLDLDFPSVSGQRRFLRAVGGKINGSGIEAEVTPQAGDWLIRRPDGVQENDQRIYFTMPDGQHIYMRSIGFTSPEGHFHCTPRFDIQAGPHDWLTRTVFAGIGYLNATGFEIKVYKLEDTET